MSSELGVFLLGVDQLGAQDTASGPTGPAQDRVLVGTFVLTAALIGTLVVTAALTGTYVPSVPLIGTYVLTAATLIGTHDVTRSLVGTYGS